MRVLIIKSARLLTAAQDGRELLRCRVALGREPVGAKEKEGDGRTPEGRYFICLIKEHGKYGRGLGLSYPGAEDARRAYALGRIGADTLSAVERALDAGMRPPWGTALGGEIYIHEGGTASDWTQGCVALETADMDVLFAYSGEIAEVEIVP